MAWVSAAQELTADGDLFYCCSSSSQWNAGFWLNIYISAVRTHNLGISLSLSLLSHSTKFVQFLFWEYEEEKWLWNSSGGHSRESWIQWTMNQDDMHWQQTIPNIQMQLNSSNEALSRSIEISSSALHRCTLLITIKTDPFCFSLARKWSYKINAPLPCSRLQQQHVCRVCVCVCCMPLQQLVFFFYSLTLCKVQITLLSDITIQLTES